MSQPKLVSQLVHEIKYLLEGEFRNVFVTGEISNLSLSSAGHWYFNISDKDSSISCALFKGDAMRNPLVKSLKDGDKVVLSGNISVYAKRGTFQIIVKKISKEGVGDLKEQFEKLKKNLAKEGLFDLSRKLPIPIYPKKVAVITAIGGAALQDFLNVCLRRSIELNIVIVPSAVQGDHAPRELMKALDKVEKKADFDLVVMTRGGGSMEDLWAFNNEALVRKMASFTVPIISAVGHQVDFTLSDYVSDRRCETPTAAAEIITQPQTEVKNKMELLGRKLISRLQGFHSELFRKIESFHPRKLVQILSDKVSEKKEKLYDLNPIPQVDRLIPLHEYHMRVDDASRSMNNSLKEKFQNKTNKISSLNGLLHALGPEKVLKRGYVYVRTSKGKVVSSGKIFDKISTQEKLKLRFHDGERDVSKG